MNHMAAPLLESLTFDQANIVVESVDAPTGEKNLYMKGIFIQGDVRNQNQRIYPLTEVRNAVSSLKERMIGGYSILGECDHPQNLQINLDRTSHMVTDMWMEGSNGLGKLKLLPTPMGNLIRCMLENGVKLGVSSRGSGNVDDNGLVEDFQIVTVDIVAQPSAPDAFPVPMYESFGSYFDSRRGRVLEDLSLARVHDRKAEKHLKSEIVKFIDTLKIR